MGVRGYHTKELTGEMDNAINGQKIDIPLLRINNSVIPRQEQDRPVITYYRVNGQAGKLEETFKMVANTTSKFSGGASYE